MAPSGTWNLPPVYTNPAARQEVAPGVYVTPASTQPWYRETMSYTPPAPRQNPVYSGGGMKMGGSAIPGASGGISTAQSRMAALGRTMPQNTGPQYPQINPNEPHWRYIDRPRQAVPNAEEIAGMDRARLRALNTIYAEYVRRNMYGSPEMFQQIDDIERQYKLAKQGKTYRNPYAFNPEY